MQGFMATLLICSATMSALALLYMAATPLLAKRYSVTGRYYTWLVIVIGLIIPFRPHLKNAIVKAALPGDMALPVIHLGNRTSAAVPAANVLPPALENIAWQQIGTAVWLAGMLAFLAYQAIRHYRFLKLVSHWNESITDRRTLALFQKLKGQMGLTKEIGLQLCDVIGTPMMTGFSNPRILLPRASFAEDELYFILKHELIHYKRKDLWYKCLVLAATAVHWFNPIVYLMAKAIDIQCELSCDKEVVRSADTDSRQFYSETVIGVVRFQSKRKTALSTNFYGGKKGMKERIFSIMDGKRKKPGIAVLCGALMLTFGTGFAFVPNAEAQGAPDMLREDAAVSVRFLPDPAIYAKYSSYGITVSDDGEMLLYNGERVRLFVDEASEDQAFFLDEAGALDLSVVRNADGSVTGIEGISKEKAQEYRSTFFAGDDFLNVEVKETVKETAGINKYEQYSAYGITLSEDGGIVYYNGQRVKLLVDVLSDGSFGTFWIDEGGTANLSVVRNAAGQITGMESISEKQAQIYKSASDENNQDFINRVEEKAIEKINALYPED